MVCTRLLAAEPLGKNVVASKQRFHPGDEKRPSAGYISWSVLNCGDRRRKRKRRIGKSRSRNQPHLESCSAIREEKTKIWSKKSQKPAAGHRKASVLSITGSNAKRGE